jgi:hypothetical protein
MRVRMSPIVPVLVYMIRTIRYWCSIHRSRVPLEGLHPCPFETEKECSSSLQIILQQFLAGGRDKKKNGSGGTLKQSYGCHLKVEINEGKEEVDDQMQSSRPFRTKTETKLQ